MSQSHGEGYFTRFFCGSIATVVPVLGLLGCAAQTPVTSQVIANPETRFAREGEKIKADPVAYLRQLGDRCEAFQQYRLTFLRQERVGAVVQSLSPVETIEAIFRKTPFSVKFTWTSPEPVYFESVYVQGQNDNKLVIRERKGIFPLPPQVRVVDPELPVKLGLARNPITDFGLARVVRRTVLPFSDTALAAVTTVAYRGVVNLEPTNRPAHHLRIERPPAPGYAYTRQDFFIDAETLLPAGTDLWLKTGELGARYRYTDIQTEVKYTDQDFRLSKDHPKVGKGEDTAPKPAASP
jgi:hypothetical protein